MTRASTGNAASRHQSPTSPRGMLAASLCVAAAVAAGCGSSAADCGRTLCGACPSSLVVSVSAPPTDVVGTIEGGTCAWSGLEYRCEASLAPGDHTVRVTLDGSQRSLDVHIDAAPAGCCTCSPTTEITMEYGAPRDAALAPDGGA